jgi:AcrR family transcriptional regulator
VTTSSSDRPRGPDVADEGGVAASERREARKAQSRSRILEAARGIFFRDGFMEANLDHVAKEAGVAKGTLYRYFENKAELYVAVLANNSEQFERKLRDAGRDATLSAPDRIRRIARFYLEHWTRNREYFQIFWALENQAVIGELPEGVLEEVTRLWQSCLQILAEIVQAGIDEGSLEPCDAWEVANLLWTLANGMIQSEASPPHRRIRKRPLAESFVRAIDLVLAALTPAHSPG